MYCFVRTKPPKSSRSRRTRAPKAFAITRFLARDPIARNRVTAVLWIRKLRSQNMNTLDWSKPILVSETERFHDSDIHC